jgi:hypothetical protein
VSRNRHSSIVVWSSPFPSIAGARGCCARRRRCWSYRRLRRRRRLWRRLSRRCRRTLRSRLPNRSRNRRNLRCWAQRWLLDKDFPLHRRSRNRRGNRRRRRRSCWHNQDFLPRTSSPDRRCLVKQTRPIRSIPSAIHPLQCAGYHLSKLSKISLSLTTRSQSKIYRTVPLSPAVGSLGAGTLASHSSSSLKPLRI